MNSHRQLCRSPPWLPTTKQAVTLYYSKLSTYWSIGNLLLKRACEGKSDQVMFFRAGFMAKIFIILAIFFTYTLQFYVPMEIVWRNTKDHVTQKYHNLAQGIMRAVFATLTGKYRRRSFLRNNRHMGFMVKGLKP